LKSSLESPLKCWNCHADTLARPFCPGCGKIAARPPEATHFDVFGLPRAHALELAALEKGYRDLSLKLHPDRFAQAEPRERRLSLEQTTALNEAYKTLKDPVRRAFYLLKLQGVDLDRDDASAQKNLPLEFLEEVMELREALDGAMEKKDLGAAQGMAQDVTARRQEALSHALEALSALERAAPGSEEAAGALTKASHGLGRVRYFTRFLEQVEAFEEEALG
jgi:molecular chaperone HscB